MAKKKQIEDYLKRNNSLLNYEDFTEEELSKLSEEVDEYIANKGNVLDGWLCRNQLAIFIRKQKK